MTADEYKEMHEKKQSYMNIWKHACVEGIPPDRFLRHSELWNTRTVQSAR